MASSIIFLDESGDLGWTFDKPYRQGGSSRFLTISALVVPTDKSHCPKRFIRDLYAKRKWDKTKEKKWGDMGPASRLEFSNLAVTHIKANPEIAFKTITVKKQNVAPHITKDGNKLYNYMIRLMLLDEMATYQHVRLVPDPRTIKVQSGSSLHDYLQLELWFTKNAATVLETCPMDSAKCRGIQFADMLAGTVQSYHEDNESAPWNPLSPHIKTKRLFF